MANRSPGPGVAPRYSNSATITSGSAVSCTVIAAGSNRTSPRTSAPRRKRPSPSARRGGARTPRVLPVRALGVQGGHRVPALRADAVHEPVKDVGRGEGSGGVISGLTGFGHGGTPVVMNAEWPERDGGGAEPGSGPRY